MARLIDLSTLGIGERNQNAFNDPERAHGWNELLKILEAAPTVDAVPVVRCRDCKHYDETDSFNCEFSFMELRRPDDFCSYGERKEGAD